MDESSGARHDCSKAVGAISCVCTRGRMIFPLIYRSRGAYYIISYCTHTRTRVFTQSTILCYKYKSIDVDCPGMDHGELQ